MAYEIVINAKALKDLKKLDKAEAARILTKIETDLSKDPPAGKMLTGELCGLFSYRVGDYRVIYTKMNYVVTVVTLGHRKEAYKQ